MRSSLDLPSAPTSAGRARTIAAAAAFALAFMAIGAASVQLALSGDAKGAVRPPSAESQDAAVLDAPAGNAETRPAFEDGAQ